MLDLITQKYPNTNYSGIMLDYYIKKLNEVIDTLNKIDSAYVKSIEVVDNAYIKVTYGDDNVKNYAIPSGSNAVFQVSDVDEDTTPMNELSVSDYEIYSCSNASDMMGAIASGVNSRIVYNSSNLLIYVSSLDWGVNCPHFWTSEYVDNSLVNKEFKIENNTSNTFKITRLS